VIEAREFGASLRRERERRGIGLDEIAEQTKVSVSLLSGLERGDLSRWPSGIFRRSFVRTYACAVGLDVGETMNEFLRVFPEDGGPVKPRPGGGHALRLTLGDAPARRTDWRRVSGAVVDAVVVAGAAAGGWTGGGGEVAAVAAVAAAVMWHGAGTLFWGMSPGMRWLHGGVPLPPRREAARPVATTISEAAAPGTAGTVDEELARPSAMLTLVSPPRPETRDRRAASRGRSAGSETRARR
jgi:transcriptional regulator with XRE-family HTH domain